MATRSYVRVAADYVKAKRALESSTKRLRRVLMTHGPQHRVARMGMTVHLHAFAAYADAYRAYFAGRPGALPGLAAKGLNQAVTAQKLSMSGADADLKAFAGALVNERCEAALRAYKRTTAAEQAGDVVVAVSEAQALGLKLPERFDQAIRDVMRKYGPRGRVLRGGVTRNPPSRSR